MHYLPQKGLFRLRVKLSFERKYSVGKRRVWEGKMLDGLVQVERTDSENV